MTKANKSPIQRGRSRYIHAQCFDCEYERESIDYDDAPEAAATIRRAREHQRRTAHRMVIHDEITHVYGDVS